MNLILARHGNTFLASEPAYYVGSQQDLPLVPFGIEQATAIGHDLAQQHGHLAAVYSGPLNRMRSTAQFALEAMHSPLPVHIDERLNELDYGLWSGLTSQEVRQRFGDEEYEAWERQSQWPKLGEWPESEQSVTARITAFAQDLTQRYTQDDTILVVASNGCLRYFLKLIPGAFEEKVQHRQLKIGTGHLCHFQYQNDAWTLHYWNRAPGE
jgi:broad specificity phosphatase PhoE